MSLKISKCKACFLSSVRRKLCTPVPGRGSIPADILFIGEAPGMTEELHGSVFVGPSGKMLDMMLQDSFSLISNQKIKDIKYYMTNTVLCRPCDETMGKNREPKPNEILKCSRWIMDIYEIVQPQIVVLIGKVSENYYKNEFRDYVSIRHPAYLIRGGGKNHPEYLAQIRKLSEVYTWLEK